MRRIVDVERMPGFDATAVNAGEDSVQGGQATADGRVVNARVKRADPGALERSRSVSRGRVYLGVPRARDAPGSHWGIETVCCGDHGAVLCVASNEAGKLWRCPACNEGAFEPR